jgi:hypothetical protein
MTSKDKTPPRRVQMATWGFVRKAGRSFGRGSCPMYYLGTPDFQHIIFTQCQRLRVSFSALLAGIELIFVNLCMYSVNVFARCSNFECILINAFGKSTGLEKQRRSLKKKMMMVRIAMFKVEERRFAVLNGGPRGQLWFVR